MDDPYIKELKAYKWKRKVRAWLLRRDTRIAEFIGSFDENITFEEIWKRMQKGKDFYKICNSCDSLARALVFGEIAMLLGCHYNVVYTLWNQNLKS